MISNHTTDTNLRRQTLRTVVLLVGACVLFVGALSAVAVALTSRAVGASGAGARTTESAPAAAKPRSI